MRFVATLLSLACLLFTAVTADKDAIGQEMLFFYYVYKMDFVANGVGGMGSTLCRGRTLCTFADFVKEVMAPNFANAYQPTNADRTLTPTTDNLASFEAVGGRTNPDGTKVGFQYQIERVLPGQTSRIPNAQLVRRVWTVARHARNSGRVAAINMQGARDAARAALGIRFENSKDLFEQALSQYLTKADQSYLIKDNDGWPNWKLSLDNVDSAYNKGNINLATRNQIKQNIKGFSQNIRTQSGAETARAHIPVLQEYQKGVTSIERWMNSMGYKIFDDGLTCKGGITKRSMSSAAMELLERTKGMVKRFFGGLPHIGHEATRIILAHRPRSEL